MAFVLTISRHLGRKLLPPLRHKCVRPALSRFICRSTVQLAGKRTLDWSVNAHTVSNRLTNHLITVVLA